MSKKNTSKASKKNAKTEVREKSPQVEQNTKTPVMSAMSGIFIILVTLMGSIGITRYILHRWSNLEVDFHYMVLETAVTVVCSAGLIVFFNAVRVAEACEKAESPDDFPCGGPFGFLAANPFILWIEISILAGILFTGFNALLFHLLGFESWNKIIFSIYKAVYSLVMIVFVHWAVLGRFLQKDWLKSKMYKNKEQNRTKIQAPKNANKH